MYGIFTYKTGSFMGQMLVNIPYMEHMGMGDIAFFFCKLSKSLRTVLVARGTHHVWVAFWTNIQYHDKWYWQQLAGSISLMGESIRTMPASKKNMQQCTSLQSRTR
jgi:hypothetical protein